MLQEVDDYSWSDKDLLGRGSFGKVFRGRSKVSGELVAVKIFDSPTTREVDVLRQCDHLNIVKVLATKAVQIKRGEVEYVVVMELATESLRDFLNNPENRCGLPDHLFLNVLKDVTNGMHYLKSQNWIHRDLKPENILRFQNSDGSSTFKLTDFGSARKLLEDETFETICGTHLFLHPVLYKEMFNANNPRKFGPNVDLWSIGVTLFNVATGTVPFKPSQVDDFKTMVKIFEMKKKTKGVISIVEKIPNGSLVVQTELPSTCLLSAELKKLVVPLLVSLFEYDHQEANAFKQYYQDVMEILDRRVIDVFHVNSIDTFKMYVNVGDNFEEFQKQVEIVSNVSIDNQILICDSQILTSRAFELNSFLYLVDKSIKTTISKTAYRKNQLKFFGSKSSNVYHAMVKASRINSKVEEFCSLSRCLTDFNNNFSLIIFEKSRSQLEEFVALLKIFKSFGTDSLSANKINETYQRIINKRQSSAELIKRCFNLKERYAIVQITSNYSKEVEQLKQCSKNVKATASIENDTNPNITFIKKTTELLELQLVSSILPSFLQKFDSFAEWYKEALELYVDIENLSVQKSILKREISSFKRYVARQRLKQIAKLLLDHEKKSLNAQSLINEWKQLQEAFEKKSLDVQSLINKRKQLQEAFEKLILQNRCDSEDA